MALHPKVFPRLLTEGRSSSAHLRTGLTIAPSATGAWKRGPCQVQRRVSQPVGQGTLSADSIELLAAHPPMVRANTTGRCQQTTRCHARLLRPAR